MNRIISINEFLFVVGTGLAPSMSEAKRLLRAIRIDDRKLNPDTKSILVLL